MLDHTIKRRILLTATSGLLSTTAPGWVLVGVLEAGLGAGGAADGLAEARGWAAGGGAAGASVLAISDESSFGRLSTNKPP